MITFNIDTESTKQIAKIASRLASVVYCLSVIGLGLILLFGLREDLLVSIIAGTVVYSLGWVVRFIITGNKDYLFKSFCENKLEDFRGQKS